MDSESRQRNITAQVAAARQADAAGLEALLAMYRPYLRLVAGRKLPRLIRPRVDASDIVQQTLLDAVRGIGDFRGQSEPEFTAWITTLLERNLLMSIRQHTLGKRDIRLERDVTPNGSAQILWHSQSTTASSLIRGEAALDLAAALEKLPPDQRTAVERRYIGQEPLQAIADEMQRSVGSVAGLIRRGVEALVNHLPSELGEA